MNFLQYKEKYTIEPVFIIHQILIERTVKFFGLRIFVMSLKK